MLSTCPLPRVSSAHKLRALSKLPLLSCFVRGRNESYEEDEVGGKKAKDIPVKGQASMRRVCVTGVCALVTLLCGCTRTRFDCVLHLLLWSHGVQRNEEGEKITQGRETEQRKRGWGRRGSMVNENINHLNETYESVSRIML